MFPRLTRLDSIDGLAEIDENSGCIHVHQDPTSLTLAQSLPRRLGPADWIYETLLEIFVWIHPKPLEPPNSSVHPSLHSEWCLYFVVSRLFWSSWGCKIDSWSRSWHEVPKGVRYELVDHHGWDYCPHRLPPIESISILVSIYQIYLKISTQKVQASQYQLRSHVYSRRFEFSSSPPPSSGPSEWLWTLPDSWTNQRSDMATT